MINLSLNKQFDIILPNTNKALALVIGVASPEQLETISKDKDLKSILNSLFKESAVSPNGDKAILELLKNNPTLKELGNISTTIKELLNTLKGEKNPLPIETALKDFFLDIKELNEPLLKEKIQNSGIFLESKLKNANENVREILSGDLKAILLKAGEEIAKSSHQNQAELLKHIDKLSLQIDYYQLLSHLSNSSSLYFPFSWDNLEEGKINITKEKEGRFYCDIDLKLKEYGELKLKLALYEENQISIHIFSDNVEFKEIVKENISLLRSALIESQITPKEIRIFDTIKKNPTSPYAISNDHIDLGFEVKA